MQPILACRPIARAALGQPARAFKTYTMPWVVIVKYGFSSIEDRDAYIKHFAEAAERVLEQEPEVLSFRITTLDSDPNRLAIFERYTSKEAWSRHLEADAFKQLSGWFASSGIQAEKVRECYNETTVGFMAR